VSNIKGERMNGLFDAKTAIENRRSVRSFKSDPIEGEAMAELSKFIKTFPFPFQHNTEIKFFKSQPTKELYYTIRAPEDNMAFISDLDPISLGKTGFIGELSVLKATSLGLSTCWIGTFKKSELLSVSPEALVGVDNPGISDPSVMSRATVCCCPVGYFEEKGLRFYDRLVKTVFSLNRKVLSELLEEPSAEPKIPQDIMFALDMGMRSPSAVNMQPWRFSFDDNFESILIGLPGDFKPFKWAYPNIDIGICASHVYCALLSLDYAPKVEVFTKNNGVVFRIFPGKKVMKRVFKRKLLRRPIKEINKGKTVATSSANRLGYNDLRGALRTVIALYPTTNPVKFGVGIALRTATALCTKIDPKNKGVIGVVRTAALVYSKLDTKQRGFNKLLTTAKTLIPVFRP
jgi:nitroreductase